MAEHREQIITAAAQQFREHGFDGISVADLMKEVGLTHGGFYGHFSSKEELTALAAERAMKDLTEKWQKWMAESPANSLQAFTRKYLSLNHLTHPEVGCLWAACGSDLARQPPSVRKVVTSSLHQLLEVIGCVVPGRTKAARDQNAVAVIATLVGAMVLARSVSDPALRDNILRSAEYFVTRADQK